MLKKSANKARKIVVVDGLARSGTTLLSSLIHSQQSAACYRGVFHEFLACDVGRWKRDYACFPLLRPKDQVRIVNDFSPNYKVSLGKIDQTPLARLFTRKLELSLSRLRSQTLTRIKRKDQTDRLSLSRWEEMCDFSSIKSFDDLDERYQSIATELDVDVLAFRWNQGYPYIDKFLRNPNHYWISVVRHPLTRAHSDFKTFGESYELDIRYTENFFN
ncbi:hypothetical protein, partial [Roseibium sp. MMSF_3544]